MPGKFTSRLWIRVASLCIIRATRIQQRVEGIDFRSNGRSDSVLPAFHIAKAPT